MYQDISFVVYERTKAKVAGVPGEISPHYFNTLSEAEQISQTPATFVGNKVRQTNRVMEHGKKYGLAGEQVGMALKTLEKEGGSIERFCHAVEKLENIEGVNGNIKTILTATEKEMGNLRGAFFELESGLQAIERGEEVININLKITGKRRTLEFDIVTQNKLIECKNWKWSDYLENKNFLEEKISILRQGLGQKNEIAREVNKKLFLHSKHPLTLINELNEFKNWLIENAIDLIEG